MVAKIKLEKSEWMRYALVRFYVAQHHEVQLAINLGALVVTVCVGFAIVYFCLVKSGKKTKVIPENTV